MNATRPTSHIHLAAVPNDAERRFTPFDEYLTALGLSERSIVVYRRAVDRFHAWCVEESGDAATITALDLSAYAQSLPQTATSKRQHRVALGHWFSSIGRLDAPTKAIRVPPKKRYMPRALEPDEATRLTEAAIEAGHPHGTAVLLGLYLGLRREEIAIARWDRFTEDAGWYNVIGKGALEATLPVHPILREHIAGQAMMFPWVFPGRRSAHIHPGTVAIWLARIAEAAGVENVSPHRLRHTAISTINDATGDLRAAQEFARHASPETTRLYTRVTAQRLQRAVASLTYLEDEPATS